MIIKKEVIRPRIIINVIYLSNKGFTKLLPQSFTCKFPHVERYFWTLVNKPIFKKILGEVKQTKPVPPVTSTKNPSDQLKQSSKSKPKDETKKEEPIKPKTKVGEEEEAPKTKPKNPLDLLPPRKMILEEWNQRLYSNTMTNFSEVAITGMGSVYYMPFEIVFSTVVLGVYRRV